MLLQNSLPGQGGKDPAYFIDSVELDYSKICINPNNIESVSVNKEPENGAIYLTTKGNVDFISLDQVLKPIVSTFEPLPLPVVRNHA